MAQFTFETVDGPGSVAGQCCLALDSHGNPRIAYAASGGKLMFASRDSGTWVREEISNAGLIAPSDSDRVCLQIDSKDNPHIAYKDQATRCLFYGFKQDNHWSFMPVPTRLLRLDPGGVTDYDFRLHFRRDTPALHDTPHFVYHDPSTGQLGYTRRVAMVFKLIVVASANIAHTLFPSMAFDVSSGSFVIAFIQARDQDDDDPSILPPLTEVLMKRIVDPFEGTLSEAFLLAKDQFRVVRPTSITADSRLCVAYEDATNRTLFASVQEASIPGLVKEKVSLTAANPVVPSVASTSRGQLRIAYGDDNKLKLARATELGGQWAVEVVDPDGGEMPSLAYEKIAPNGHLAYSVRQTLKYARWTEQP